MITNVPLFALIAFTTAEAENFPATTWYVKIDVNNFLFSGFSNVATVPFGNLLNASLTGANTVKGPSLFNTSTNPAAFTAATNVVNASFEAATATIVFFVWSLIGSVFNAFVGIQNNTATKNTGKNFLMFI